MEIEVKQDEALSQFDTGGGTREIKTIITIDNGLSPRNKRAALIYETLGACLDYVLTHEQVERLKDTLMDALDQLEPI